MRTSLKRIKALEDYLFGHLTDEARLFTEAHLIINSDLSSDLKAQSDAYTLIKMYGRLQTNREIERVHQQLFHQEKHRNFRQRVFRIFQHD